MHKLPPELRQAVDDRSDAPIALFDERTNKRYVLVSAELFDRLRGYEDGDIDPRDFYPATDQAFAELWDDPKMADYDRYDELRPQ
jgi:hypothetical protein